jgi:hypothetical protein
MRRRWINGMFERYRAGLDLVMLSIRLKGYRIILAMVQHLFKTRT